MVGKLVMFKVTGVTFEDRQEIIENLTGREVVEIVPEQENKYDKNTLAVYVRYPSESGQLPDKVGYVPSELAAKIAPILDGGVMMAKFDEITGGFITHAGERAVFGMVISLELP